MELIEQQIYAQSLTMEKFYHKTDKAGKPYLYHLHKVATMSFYMGWKFAPLVEDKPDFAMKCFLTGLLHDIVEDTDVTVETLSEYFDAEVVKAVSLVTRLKGEPYEDYFENVLSSDNLIALIVKYCDACHNGDARRYPYTTKEIRKKCKKYHERAKRIANKLIIMKYV